MARITICDLCKQKMSNKGIEQGKLVLSFFKDLIQKHTMEVCLPCTQAIMERFRSEDPPRIMVPQKDEALPEVQTPRRAKRTLPGAPQAVIGPTEAEKAERQPTEKLLDDEIQCVPSAVNHTKGSRELRETWRDEDKKQGCAHHYKQFKEGKVLCADAPPGVKAFAGFRGCGKQLTDGEL